MLGLVFLEAYFNRALKEAMVETEVIPGKSNSSLKRIASLNVIDLKTFGLFPPLPTRILVPLLRMVNVLAPILVKLLLMLDLMASMADKIPTSAVIPMAIISMVIIALSLLDLIAVKAISVFSRSNKATLSKGKLSHPYLLTVYQKKEDIFNELSSIFHKFVPLKPEY